MVYISGLAQERLSNSIANALELCRYATDVFMSMG